MINGMSTYDLVSLMHSQELNFGKKGVNRDMEFISMCFSLLLLLSIADKSVVDSHVELLLCTWSKS